MNHGRGVSRGDRNRNVRLSRLRAAVPVANAIVGIDPAERKQMVVVTITIPRCWPAGRATGAGYAGVTVAGEPTGHRWRVLGQLATQPGNVVRVRAADPD